MARFLTKLLFAALAFTPSALLVLGAGIDVSKSALERRYTTAHSLPNGYGFDPRDGWKTINVTNLQYKYSPRDGGDLETRESKTTSADKSSATGLVGSLSKVIDTMKAIGSPEPVTITWYTGHDLLNPSCWSNPTWHPTDESFACALTEEGWTDHPACFKFLELCNSPKKCVFVRVVDSCAGCAAGSKHVDLTKAAFTTLADLSEGVLTVQMRQASNPDGWLDNLWGPQN